MLITCDNVLSMAKMIQIRNVPEPIHRTLKARAAQAGMTLSDFLLAEIADVANRPTIPELTESIRARQRARLKGSAASAVRRLRSAR